MMEIDWESLLQKSLDPLPDSRVKQAMAYSLLAPGKRIRPQLLVEVIAGYGKDPARGYPFACALEMVHTYSLIHDDLPAMDNDDLRRGRPTCHRQFDEATAILAGDGLLTQAFATASEAEVPADQKVSCIHILSEMAGSGGMVYGQCLDTLENPAYDWEKLKQVHNAKTGCLLAAPLMMGAVLADHSGEVERWHQIGLDIGLAFQIQDDILDATESAQQLGKSNSDARNEKVTSVSLLGLKGARRQMEALYAGSVRKIQETGGFKGDSLCAMIGAIQSRKK